MAITYKLTKEFQCVRDGNIKIIKPQTLTYNNSTHEYQANPEWGSCAFEEVFMKQNPDYFTTCVNWGEGNYFRNGCESINVTKNKVYSITKVDIYGVYFTDDNNENFHIDYGSRIGKLATPATTAEYLEQQNKSKKEMILEKYFKIIDDIQTTLDSDYGMEICGDSYIIKAHVKVLLKESIEEAIK